MRPVGRVLAVAAVLWALPAVSRACAVCFGAEDAPMTIGMNNGILTLLGVIGAVQVCFIALFVGFWRRSKSARRQSHQFRLIQGGVE